MTTTPPAPLDQAQLRSYRGEGYLVIGDLLPARDVAAFVEHERTRNPQGGLRGLQNHRQDQAWARIAHHPEVVTRVRQLIGGPPRIVQTMYLAKPPRGGTGVALHQDTHYIRNEPDTLMACWIALADTGPDNGGLCVVPGSHHHGLYEAGPVRELDQHADWQQDYEMRDRQGRTWVESMHSFDIHAFSSDQVEMLTVPKGGGVLFTGHTVHGSYANLTSDRPRPAFATHYVGDGTWVFRRDLQDPVAA